MGSQLSPQAEQALPAVSNIVSAILENPASAAIWAKYNHSKAENSPVGNIVAGVESLQEPYNASEAQLRALQFAHALIENERKALGRLSKNDSLEIRELKTQVESLNRFLSSVVRSEIPTKTGAGKIWQNIKEPFLPRHHRLPDNERGFLGSLERETCLKPVKPLQAVGYVVGNIKDGVKEQARQHPYIFSMFTLATAAATTLITLRTGVAVSQKEPESTAIIPTAYDQYGNIIAGTVDRANINYDFQPSCDDHFKQFAPKISDYLEKHGVDTSGFFNWLDQATEGVNLIPHCSRLKDIAFSTENLANNVYHVSKWPMEVAMNLTVQGPIQSVGDTAFQGTQYMEGFSQGATVAANHIYAFNAAENATVHGSMLGASLYLTTMGLIVASLKMMNKEQRQEVINSLAACADNVSDYARSLQHAPPLKFLFSMAAGGAAWAQHAAVSDKLWDNKIAAAAILGALAGYVVEKIRAVSKNKDHVLGITAGARDALAEFANAASGIPEVTNYKTLGLGEQLKGAAKTKTAMITAGWLGTSFALAAAESFKLIGPDSLLAKVSETKAFVDAYALAWLASVPVQIVEDTAQHIGVTGLGAVMAVPAAIVALPLVLGHKGIKYMAQKMSQEVKRQFRAAALSTTLAVTPVDPSQIDQPKEPLALMQRDYSKPALFAQTMHI